MIQCSLRFATFLAPNMLPVYRFIIHYVGCRLGCRTELFVGASYEEMTAAADGGFVCGLPYVGLLGGRESPVQPLVAPVLRGERYGGRPVYYSDVIVRRDSPLRSFADLRGCTWSFNEPLSHSGYGVTRYHLARLGETNGYFGRVVEAGYHERSIELVAAGAVDASAIDSQVLAVWQRENPGAAQQIRVIDSLGPSTIQPFVVARRLPQSVREDIRSVLLEMGYDPAARPYLDRGLIERFVAVSDADYDDIREMRRLAETTAAVLALDGASAGWRERRRKPHH